MRKRGLCRSERDHTDRRVGREMYNKTECFQDPHGPPKAETQLFQETADHYTDLGGRGVLTPRLSAGAPLRRLC